MSLPVGGVPFVAFIIVVLAVCVLGGLAFTFNGSVQF
jgi:hypothetical protein